MLLKEHERKRKMNTTDIYVSPEAMEDIRNSFVDQTEKNKALWNLHDYRPNWMDMNATPVPILIKPVHIDAKPLYKKRPSDIAWDVSCVADIGWKDLNWTTPYFDLMPGESHTFHTGITVAVPEHYGFLFQDRSSLGIRDIIHSAGVVEGTYRDEWHVHLINLGDTTYSFRIGDRIIQAVLTPIFPAKTRLVDELPGSDRGKLGLGSSGR